MISKRMSDALNEQLNFEIYSSYIYVSMSSWLKAKNLNGFANWMHIQFQEEIDHATKFYDFLHDYGASVEYDAIPKPQKEWDSVTAVFEHALEHEGIVTSRINNLIDIALEEKDHATNARLQWFITEQVEEEANFVGLVEQLKMAEASPEALLLLDRELATRVFVPSQTK